MKSRPQYNFVKHINLSVFVPITLFTIIILLFYIVSGLEDTYQNKRHEVERISELLAISSSSATSLSVASNQIAKVSLQDPAIESTKFYPLERVIDIDNTELIPFHTILTQSSISIQEPVISNFGKNNNSGVINDQALMGYMNTTINLQQLRQQWLVDHIYYLIAIVVSYIFLAWFVYSGLTRPLEELDDLSDEALAFMASNYDNLKPLLRKELHFYELGNIRSVLRHLDDKCNEYYDRYNTLQQRIDRSDLRFTTSEQNSSFQSMIIHELKTSLNIIFDGLQHIQSNYMSNEQQEAVDIISKGSNQLEFTLSQIIQLNRIEKGQMSVSVVEFQPLQLISELVNKYTPIANNKGVAIESTINHVDCILMGDDKKIQSVLEVLVNNAVKYTEQGKVTVESNLLYFEEGVRWTINVIDTGIGIEAKHLKDIFLPFFQVDPSIDNDHEGVGIGLGLAKRLTQLLKGQLSVVSEIDKGSQFSLVVHLKTNQQAQDLNVLEDIKIVYLSEDEVEDSLKHLQGFGAQIVLQESSEALLEYIERNQANILMIAEDIKQNEAIEIARKVRDKEVSSRLFINYARDNLSESEISKLHAAGVDFCEPFKGEAKEQAMILRSWLAL